MDSQIISMYKHILIISRDNLYVSNMRIRNVRDTNCIINNVSIIVSVIILR